MAHYMALYIPLSSNIWRIIVNVSSDWLEMVHVLQLESSLRMYIPIVYEYAYYSVFNVTLTDPNRDI